MEYKKGDLLDFGPDTDYTDEGVSLIGILVRRENSGTGDFWIKKHNGSKGWETYTELCLGYDRIPIILNKKLEYESYY